MTYKIISVKRNEADCLDKLTKEMNKQAKSGWRPAGSPFNYDKDRIQLLCCVMGREGKKK